MHAHSPPGRTHVLRGVVLHGPAHRVLVLLSSFWARQRNGRGGALQVFMKNGSDQGGARPQLLPTLKL